jgi:uncharacterized phage protein (TIGR01671 family)
VLVAAFFVRIQTNCPMDFKFRAYNYVAKKMYYENTLGDVFKWENEGQIQTIMQCLGQQDIDGKDIYDRDIISFTFFYYGETEIEVHKIGIVKFIKGSFVFWVSDEEYYAFSELMYDSQTDIVIQGNTFENPEILGVL